MYLSPFVLFLLNVISSYWGILIPQIYLGNGLLAPHSPLVCFVTIINLGLNQLVAFPTHSKGSIFDLVFSNYPSSVINLRSSTSISDHFLVTFQVCCSVFKTVPALDKEVWLYSKTDFVSLADFALDFDFGNCYQVTG